MALTVSIPERFNFGSRNAVVASVTFDATYPAGGEPLTPADLQMGRVNLVTAEASDGYVFEYDHTNEKLLAYECAAAGSPMAEPGTESDVDGVVVRLLVIGE